jgi:hypothetical protein
MKYWSLPFQVDAEQWTDIDDPPMGIHDPWTTTGTGTVYGYLPTPTGDILAWVNCYVVRFPSGAVSALSEEEFKRRFNTKDVT